MAVITINIDFDRKCSACGKSGVVKNGLCISCIADGVRIRTIERVLKGEANQPRASVNGE